MDVPVHDLEMSGDGETEAEKSNNDDKDADTGSPESTITVDESVEETVDVTMQDDSVDDVEELEVTDDGVDPVTEPVGDVVADETCDSSVSVDTSSGSSALEGSRLEAPEELTFSFNHFDDEDGLNDSALSNTIPYGGPSVAGSPATSSFLETPPRRTGRVRFPREITTYDTMGVPSTRTANGENKASKTKKSKSKIEYKKIPEI